MIAPTQSTAAATGRVVVHVGDPALHDRICAALAAAGWACDAGAEGPAGTPGAATVVLVALEDPAAPPRALVAAYPEATVVVLADGLSPAVLQAARALHARAVIPRVTPPPELPLVLAAHVR